MKERIEQIAALAKQLLEENAQPQEAQQSLQQAQMYAALYNFTTLAPTHLEENKLPTPYQIKKKSEALFNHIEQQLAKVIRQEETQPQEERLLEQAQLVHAMFIIAQECTLVPNQQQEDACYSAAEKLIDESFKEPHYGQATTQALCDIIADYFNPIETAEPHPLVTWYNQNKTIINNPLPDNFFSSLCQEVIEQLQLECVA